MGQFEWMTAAALGRLRGRDPGQISRLGAVDFDGQAFRFESLGRAFTLSWPQCRFDPAPAPWQALTILHYLDLADGTALTREPITFAGHRDGLVRGGGFDREVEQAIRRDLGRLPPLELRRRCAALGGVEEPSNADLCVRFQFMPRYPLWLKLWFADEEFPASGRLLLDASAERYLSIEDAVTVGALVLERLRDA